jgi:peptidyl-prolyl cis-trans isomerase B (cyclophilin B)
MKALSFALAVLILLIVAIFIFSSKQVGNGDILIPSPDITSPSKPTEMKFSTNSANKKDEELPFPLLGSEDIKGKKITIETEKGSITFELFDDAPLASSNFIDLISKQYYDGLTFHRREEGFVIQGGDPRGDGTGGPGYKFSDEVVTRDYERGIVAMANAGPNTNGSQFFIMLEDSLSLPKNYTIFGKVTEGIDVVDKIQIGDVMTKVTIE